MATANQHPVYFTEIKVAEITGLSLSKLRQDRMKGTGIPYCKLGRSVRYDAQDVQGFMDQHKIQTEG